MQYGIGIDMSGKGGVMLHFPLGNIKKLFRIEIFCNESGEE